MQTQYPIFLAKFSPGCGRVAVTAGTRVPCRTISAQRFFQWLLQAILLPLRVKTEVCRLSCTRFSISLSTQELLQGGWDVTDSRWPTYDLEHLNENNSHLLNGIEGTRSRVPNSTYGSTE
jgi:hypothetical protein